MTPTPRRKHEWKDEYTLLCERCGYILEDLDHALPCPECGKPISESLPERRVGTPWQQKPGFKSLLQTWWMTVKHPLKTLDAINLNERMTMGLATSSLLYSGGFIYLLIQMIEIMNPYSDLTVRLTSLGGIGSAILLITIFVVLTVIELTGLKVISKSRGFRITEPVAYQIVNHGSVGWVWCGTFIALSFYCLVQSGMHNTNWNEYPPLPWSQRPFVTGYTLSIYYKNLSLILFLLSLVGFIFFETFAYLGLRRCKYANRTRPNPAPNQTPKP
tara:strand:+ start:351 stop:1169 length:819 start_codon:yes stop_codon:yes gene_type:complete